MIESARARATCAGLSKDHPEPTSGSTQFLQQHVKRTKTYNQLLLVKQQMRYAQSEASVDDDISAALPEPLDESDARPGVQPVRNRWTLGVNGRFGRY